MNSTEQMVKAYLKDTDHYLTGCNITSFRVEDVCTGLRVEISHDNYYHETLNISHSDIYTWLWAKLVSL